MRNDVVKRCRVIYERGPILKWFNFPCRMFLVRVVRYQFVSDETYYISSEIVFESQIIITIFGLSCSKYQFSKFRLKCRLKKNSYCNLNDISVMAKFKKLNLKYFYNIILTLRNSNYIIYNNYFDVINRNYKLLKILFILYYSFAFLERIKWKKYR